MARRVIEICGGTVSGKKIGILGVAFKPNTDDVRDAPSLKIIPLLQEAGATITAYDPAAMGQAKQLLENVHWKNDPYQVAEDTDALVIITEWNEFRALDLGRLGQIMKEKCLVDLRSIYKPADMEGTGFHYVSIGRPEVKPQIAALKKAAGA